VTLTIDEYGTSAAACTRDVMAITKMRFWVGRHRRASARVTGVRNAPTLQRRCGARARNMATKRLAKG
jgi:hypothetical protein